MPPHLQERFRGCLLGLAVGDALGGLFQSSATDKDYIPHLADRLDGAAGF